MIIFLLYVSRNIIFAITTVRNLSNDVRILKVDLSALYLNIRKTLYYLRLIFLGMGSSSLLVTSKDSLRSRGRFLLSLFIRRSSSYLFYIFTSIYLNILRYLFSAISSLYLSTLSSFFPTERSFSKNSTIANRI